MMRHQMHFQSCQAEEQAKNLPEVTNTNNFRIFVGPQFQH